MSQIRNNNNTIFDPNYVRINVRKPTNQLKIGEPKKTMCDDFCWNFKVISKIYGAYLMLHFLMDAFFDRF